VSLASIGSTGGSIGNGPGMLFSVGEHNLHPKPEAPGPKPQAHEEE